MTIISFSVSVSAFVSVKMFPIMLDTLDINGTMYIYGICCFAGAIFVLVVLKETSGKSLDDIPVEKQTKKDINCSQEVKI